MKKSNNFFFLAVALGVISFANGDNQLEQRYNYNERFKEYKDINIPDIVKINDMAVKKNQNLKDIPKNENQNMKDFSKSLVDKTNSPDFQNQLKDMKEYILNDKQLGYEEQMQEFKQTQSQEKNSKEILSNNERFYIVVSSSLSDSLIKKYIKQTEPIKNDVEFILRGTIGGHKKMKPTLDWRNEILKKGDSYYTRSIKVDPQTVRKYGIKRVPAFLYINDITDQNSSYDVVYGSVHIFLALKELTKINNSKSLKKLSEKFN